LSEAILKEAFLNEASLKGVLLDEADLTEAYLPGADLTEARLITNEQLAHVRSLKGATMPDGQTLRGDKTPNGPTFEDWLKSKGSGKDGENSTPS
jgi:uncharacterized protein YjbI with pentapeptide repeats